MFVAAYHKERQIHGAGCQNTKGAPPSPIGQNTKGVPHNLFEWMTRVSPSMPTAQRLHFAIDPSYKAINVQRAHLYGVKFAHPLDEQRDRPNVYVIGVNVNGIHFLHDIRVPNVQRRHCDSEVFKRPMQKQQADRWHQRRPGFTRKHSAQM